MSPSALFIRERLPVYEGDRLDAELTERRFELGFDIGRQLGHWGELRAGVRWSDGRTRPIIGGGALRSAETGGGGIFLRLATDTLDSADFPRRGVFSEALIGAVREELGAERSFELAQFNVGIARSFGKNTLVGLVDATTTFGETDAPSDLARAGGFLNLSGFDRNQLAGEHAITTRLVGYRQVASPGLLNYRFDVYLGASLELGGVWPERSDASVDTLFFAGSLFLGMETPLGPLYLGYGMAEGGRSSTYLFLGRAF